MYESSRGSRITYFDIRPITRRRHARFFARNPPDTGASTGLLLLRNGIGIITSRSFAAGWLDRIILLKFVLQRSKWIGESS